MAIVPQNQASNLPPEVFFTNSACMAIAAQVQASNLPPEVASSSGGSSGGRFKLPGLFSKVKHATSEVLGGAKKPELPEDEAALRQAKAALVQLREQLSAATAFARTFVAHMEQMCSDYGDLGKCLNTLAKYDEGQISSLGQYTEAGGAAAQRAADLNKVSTRTIPTSKVRKELFQLCT